MGGTSLKVSWSNLEITVIGKRDIYVGFDFREASRSILFCVEDVKQ